MEMVLCIASPADRQCCEVGSNAGQSFMENGILAPGLLRLHKLQSATTALFAHNYKVALLLVHTVGLNISKTQRRDRWLRMLRMGRGIKTKTSPRASSLVRPGPAM